MRFTRPEIHRFIYFFGLTVFAASLVLSNYFMSLAQWLLVLNLFAGGRYAEKLKRLWANKGALLIIGILLLHALGLLWSQDLDYALKDLRVKLPILVLTFIMAAEEPLSRKRLHGVLLVHLLAVTAGSIVITYRIYGLGITDARDASILISHIRFALNLCTAIFALIWLQTQKPLYPLILRIAGWVWLCWLLLFLFFLQSATGFALFLITGTAMLLRAFYLRARKPWKVAVSVFLLLSATAFVSLAVMQYHDAGDADERENLHLEYVTPYGNEYIHNLENPQKENGHYLWMYVCFEEMDSAWSLRSRIPFDSLGKTGEEIRYTLVRYLSSKGLRKDFDAVMGLGQDEISAIEKGVANVKELEAPGLHRRLTNLVWELQDYAYIGDPRNHSMMQRVELWKASLGIVASHPVCGVGTGDVPLAFGEELKAMNSSISDTGLRTHNQYLAIAVAFGIPGLLYFLFALFYAPVRNRKMNSFLFLSFFIIGMLSMITEDTLESQAGVSFFIFFYALLLFAADGKKT